MTDAAPLPENQHSRFRPAMAAADPDRGEEVEKWAIIACTVLGLAGLVVLHFNGGRVHFTRKRTSFSFEVGRERSSTDESGTISSPPEDQ
jgi:hypothetical protein